VVDIHLTKNPQLSARLGEGDDRNGFLEMSAQPAHVGFGFDLEA
jgi:hypothetical protein